MKEARLINRGFSALFPPAAAAIRRFRDTKELNEFQIDTIWNTSIRGYSLTQGEGENVLGEGFDVVILCEGDTIPPEIYERRIIRAMSRAGQVSKEGYEYPTGRLYCGTTAHYGEGTASHIFSQVLDQTNGQPEKLHFGEVPWRESVFLHTDNVLANPSYSREEYEFQKRTLGKTNPDAFAEQYEGKTVRRAQLVYDTFSSHNHLVQAPSPDRIKRMRLSVGIDTGGCFAAVLCGLDQDGTYYILDEVYGEGRTIMVDCEEVKEMCVRTLAPLANIDANAMGIQAAFEKVKPLVDAWMIDRQSQHKEDTMELLDVGTSYNTLSKESSIDRMRNLFAENKLYVVEDCWQWLRDANRYSYRAVKGRGIGGKNQFVPQDKYDHLSDAARFAIIGYLETAGPIAQEKAPITFEQAWEEHMKERFSIKNQMRQPTVYELMDI